MLKVLMVDVDGVLVHGRSHDGRHWSSDLETDLGLAPDLLQREFFAPHWEAVVLGRAALRARLVPVLARIAPALSAERLIDYWFAADARFDQRLLADLTKARTEGLQIHLATNQEHERTSYLLDTLGLRERIDGCHYSAALGCRKPQAAFFEAVIQRVGCEPSELLLIDDVEENVTAAKAAGWRAVQWTSGSTLAAVLQ